MPYPNKPNPNALKLAAIDKFGVNGMRWGERALRRKAEEKEIIHKNTIAKQAKEDSEVVSAIADAMEMEVRGNRRRTKDEKRNHISQLMAVHSRLFGPGVDSRLLMELIQSTSMNYRPTFRPSTSVKGSVSLKHSDSDRPTASQILKHALFLRGLSEKLDEKSKKYYNEVERDFEYFSSGESLKSVSDMTEEELIEHYRPGG